MISALAIAALGGCDGTKSSVVVADLSGIPAYTGDWQPVGGNGSWKRPAYAVGTSMSPPMRVHPKWDSVILLRKTAGGQTAEIDGRPLVTGQLRWASWTQSGCPQISVQQVQLSGKIYGPFRDDGLLIFAPDGKHWSLTGQREDGVRIVYVDGAERMKLKNDDPRSLIDWVATPDGGWQPAIRLTPTADSGWTDLDGKTIAGPATSARRKPAAEVKLDNKTGPTTVTVNGSTIGTFTFVLSGSEVGENGLAAKYGVDATGRLVMYAVDGEGQLLRLSIPQ